METNTKSINQYETRFGQQYLPFSLVFEWSYTLLNHNQVDSRANKTIIQYIYFINK